MRRIAVILSLFVLVQASMAAEHHPRVVLLSIDAGSDVILDRLLAAHVLKGGAFEQIRRRGVVAESMTPATISSTPVSHPTIFSGSWPGTHGITGVALPGQEISGELRSGFATPTAVDRLWIIAQRAGKRVICIAAPGAEANTPESTCTETVTFNSISQAGQSAVPELGPSPGDPAGTLPTTGRMTEDEYIAGGERFADYISDAVKRKLARTDWDLLIVYIPLIDGLEHRYLLTDPRQVEYGDEGGARRERFASFIERGYRKMDAIVGSWLAASPDTDFIIVSDHGMVPTHSVVLVNNALAAAGLRVGGADAEVRAISSGASVQVYVNSKRHFAHGTIADADVPDVVARVVRVLRDLRDPVSGKPIYRTVATRDDYASLHLDHANAGDVFASAIPGWGNTSRFDPAVPVIVPSTLSPDARARVSRTPEEEAFLAKGGLNELSIGIHGHQPGDPRTQAIFYAIGPDVPHRQVGTIAMIDVAPTILQILGIARPKYMTGRLVFDR